jgi:hypothetical protein
MSDPIQGYLAQLRASLRTRDADRILAEAEDHLHETVSAGLAAGLTEREAHEAAISAFWYGVQARPLFRYLQHLVHARG